MTPNADYEPVICTRCGHVLVDRDDRGWYYQTPVREEFGGSTLTFMDRVHDCDGQPHALAHNDRSET